MNPHRSECTTQLGGSARSRKTCGRQYRSTQIGLKPTNMCVCVCVWARADRQKNIQTKRQSPDRSSRGQHIKPAERERERSAAYGGNKGAGEAFREKASIIFLSVYFQGCMFMLWSFYNMETLRATLLIC